MPLTDVHRYIAQLWSARSDGRFAELERFLDYLVHRPPSDVATLEREFNEAARRFGETRENVIVLRERILARRAGAQAVLRN